MSASKRTVSPSPSLDFCHLRAASNPRPGHEAIVDPQTRSGDRAGMGMAFGLLRLRKGQRHIETTSSETVFVLLGGGAAGRWGGRPVEIARASLFDEGPTTLHAGAGTAVELRATMSGTEFAVVRSPRTTPLPVRIYTPDEVATEDRGAGLVQGACRRLVRTVFDHGTRPDSDLVVGEVVNYPGRWSSYPGHHHPQPEIYHYRFTLPQGYGHAEIGERVFKVRHGDTTTIPAGLDHAQVSAPGYGMYYLWIVRHLPRRPYRGFVFSPEHRWLLDPSRQGWQPRNESVTP